MKINLWLCILFFISIPSFGQKVQVFDAQNRPIENVIVIGDDFTTHTNSQGIIIFFPDEGTSQLAFIHPNYQRITLSWNQLANVDFKIVLEERIRQLEEVTIRPLKRAQMLSDVPQKVVALTPQDAQLYQPQTTADLLGTSGEVYIQKSQMGGGSPMIRGFSANRIMLVVDGVRMNNAIYRGGNLHNVISMDASGLEQTEVILGPGSVIYGSDALGGVIHFYTLYPRLSTAEIQTPFNAMIRTSSANFEKTAHMNFNLAGKKWASLTSITFSDFDNLKMGTWQHPGYTRNHYVETVDNNDITTLNPNPNNQVSSGYSQLNAIQKIRFRPSDKANFEYAIHFATTSDIPRYDRLIQYSGDNLKYAEWFYGPQKWMMQSLKAELTSTSEILNNLTFLAAYQDYTESRHDRKFGNNHLQSRTENVDIFSLNIDADKYFTKSQSLFYGVEGVFNKVHSTGIETNIFDQSKEEIASRYPNGSEWWSLAAYVMYNQLLSAKTSLQAGARYSFSGMNGTFNNTYYNFPFDGFSNSDGGVTVNFGMVFKPSEQTRFNVNAATGFRSPNIDDAAKVFDSTPGTVMVPNPQLESEYASSFEAGYHWNGFDKFHWDATLFFTRLHNAMVRRDGQLNGQDSIIYDGQLSKVVILTNASWANIVGLSTRFGYAIHKHFKLKGGINWQAGTDSDEMPVRHVAPLFGDFHVETNINRVKLDAYAIFNGRISYENLSLDEREKVELYASDTNGYPFSPPWWTLNLKGNYSVSENLNLGFGVENILNVRYRPYSSGIVAPSLNFIFSLHLKL